MGLLFGQIENAKFSEGGAYVLPGVYRFEIQKVIAKLSRLNKNLFIVDLKVFESTNKDRMPNSICSWVVTITADSPALGNIKNFIAAACNAQMEQVTEAIAEAVISDKQPLKGKFVRASAVDIKTKQGRDFTKVKWFADSEGAAASANHAQESAQVSAPVTSGLVL